MLFSLIFFPTAIDPSFLRFITENIRRREHTLPSSAPQVFKITHKYIERIVLLDFIHRLVSQKIEE
jgi:hypothetical protein